MIKQFSPWPGDALFKLVTQYNRILLLIQRGKLFHQLFVRILRDDVANNCVVDRVLRKYHVHGLDVPLNLLL